jgi:hypothetical protein
MSAIQQKPLAVLYTKLESIIIVHCEFSLEYGERSPDDKSIGRWYKHFTYRQYKKKKKKRHSTRLPRRSDEDANRVRQNFILIAKKPTS